MVNRILIVDDSSLNRKILWKILNNEYEVLEASNGQEALEIIQKEYENLSAIVLDLIMPVMSGKELLNILGKNKKYHNLPILIATGEHDQAIERECLGMGAWDFVIKPFDPMIIRLRLKNIIGRSQTHLMKQIKELAEYDSLTGLYNRQYFMSQTRNLLNQHKDEEFALIRLDIDHFKLYNSSLGSKAGNKLLIKVAEQIRVDMKKLKTTHVTYARIESDVFCVCVPYHKESIEKTVQGSSEYLHRFDANYRLKASFGIYVIKDNEEDMEEIYSHTVEAASRCKHNLNKVYDYYGDQMSKKEKKAQVLTNEMETALKERQFQVYLQPKYSVESEKPCGAEALVRWCHPTWGMVSPGEFIPVFEQNGLIMQLDYYMWDSVCALLGKWIKQGEEVYPVSVNISRISMYNPHIVNQIVELTEKYQVPKELLQLEVTESAYMSNPGFMKDIISAFHELGFMILLDDFGSGYSSLNMLKDIEVDILKIDMKFLPTGHNNVKSEKILASVVRMAGWLGMPAIVEGVETREQKEFVESIGCNYIQGFYFARPMPVSDYEELIAHQKVYRPDNSNLPNELLKQFDQIWSSDMNTDTLLRSVAVPFALLEYFNFEIDVLRMNEPFRAEFGQRVLSEILNYKEMAKLKTALDEVVLSQEKGECDCLFLMSDGQSKWYHIRLVYIGSIDKTNLVSITCTDVTIQRLLEKELNQVFNSIYKSDKKRNKLLVVDDVALSRELIANLFEDDFEVLQAPEGEIGLKILKENSDSIAAILLDMVMPQMDGREFLAYKNNMPNVAEIPVVIISSETDANLQIHMLSQGVNDYVTKPFVPAVVKKRVKNVIEYNSRFRYLVREFHQGRKTTEGEKNSIIGYPYKELMEMIHFLSNTFEVVRLVDPTSTSVITLQEDGSVQEEPYTCFKVWGKKERCMNCSSLCSLEGHCTLNKFELMKDNIFYIISQPVEVWFPYNETRSMVLELVGKITDEKALEKKEANDIYALLAKSYDMIYMDPLTNAYNRRFLDDALFLQRGKKKVANEVAVIMMDVNHFKEINDMYGHQVGDRVLKEITQAIKHEIRYYDSLVRYGGDEFVIILTNCKEQYIQVSINRFEQAVRKVKYGPKNVFSVAADFGYAYTEEFFVGNAQQLANMLQIADKKMYEQKKQKRIGVEISNTQSD